LIASGLKQRHAGIDLVVNTLRALEGDEADVLYRNDEIDIYNVRVEPLEWDSLVVNRSGRNILPRGADQWRVYYQRRNGTVDDFGLNWFREIIAGA
jgi:hypothetical protein